VSDERVEKLVEKYAMDLSEYHDDNGYALDATKYVAVEGFRAALQEARREALKEAAEIVTKQQVPPLSQEAGAEVRRYHNRALGMAAMELERLAGEEGTK
jgi:hypothetical protein